MTTQTKPEEHELDELERRQRAELPSPTRLRRRETSRVRIPEEGALPRSQELLGRIYADQFLAAEKKPMVVDTRRCWGPYMVSIDPQPLVVLDACSQIATLSHGFAHPDILRELHSGRFGQCLWSNPDTAVEVVSEVQAFADAVRIIAPQELTHVSLACAGGAEANEKALRIARLHAPAGSGRTRVLAFRGGFHGRTFAALMATWNPKKRAAFELPGYESVFCETDLEVVASTLKQHHQELYAVIIEPMMGEGGDIHLAGEFFRGLVKLTREYKLPLIVDEVQTGFGTGGTPLWWQRLGLTDDPEATPDLMTIAKKAALGVVLSRWPDPEQAYNQVNVASVIRGHIQLSTCEEMADLELPLAEELTALAKRFPELLSNPRVAGCTFAFEVPSPEHQQAFIGQRLQRGFMTYGAGTRTIRFRLNAQYSRKHISRLFVRIAATLERLDAEDACTWRTEGSRKRKIDRGVSIREVRPDDWPKIMKIEDATYEPERCDSEAYLRRCEQGGVGLVAIDTTEATSEEGPIIGFCVGAPVERFEDVGGPDRDPRLHRGDTFYSADVTVARGHRGRGVGRMLKLAQIEWAKLHGFKYVAGRNRVGMTTGMMRLNQSLGAYEVEHLLKQYGGKGAAIYYHIPLGAPPDPPAVSDALTCLASGIQRPFGPRPAFMATREWEGPLANKLNLSNYATLDTVHYVELLRKLAPRGTRHAYFTSSRDELIDKSLRCLKLSRPNGRIAIGFEGGYVGHITAAARSLSDPAGFGPNLALFEWPRIPHPQEGSARTLAALETIVAREGADAILAVVVEVVGERSGHVLAGEQAAAFHDACKEHDIPLVFVETASGGYRCGPGPWACNNLPPTVVPDMVLWYPGGQLGNIFVNDRYWVGKPLTLISTWDGDEVSIIRTHEHLRAAHKLGPGPLVTAGDALGRLLHDIAAEAEGVRVGGMGLYRTLSFPSAEMADRFYAQALSKQVRFGRGLPNVLIAAPSLDTEVDTLTAMHDPLIQAIAAAK